jgi:hypothetical protein
MFIQPTFQKFELYEFIACINEKCMFIISLNMLSMTMLEVLVDTAAHSGHGILIQCDIGAKTVSRSGNEYLIYI